MIYLQTSTYNLDIAKVLGVMSSIFLTCLDINYSNALHKNTLNANNTFSLSRADIYEQTGLSDDDQIEVENHLQECGVIQVKPLQNIPNKNYYILNDEQLKKIMEAQNPDDVISSASKQSLFRSRRTEPASKRQTRIKQLKNKISVEDPVLQDYFVQWIDAVYSNPKGFLSPSGVVFAQQELLEYAKDNQAKQIAILKIAIKGGLRDMTWAIQRYEEQNGGSSRNFANYNDIKLSKEEVSSSGEIF